jgi:pSer/pThr/pTyr-binding forkhead associated (FHA) protein
MPTCPAGHTSASSDFCDVCGARIGASASTPQAPQALAAQSPEPAEPCPQCGAARSGRFCESCGFDFDADPAPAAEGTGPAAPAESAPPPGGPVPASGGAAPPPGEPAPASGAADPGAPASAQASRGPVTWTAVVASPDATALTYPAYSPERRFELAGPEMRIGRRSVSQGLEPEIDLTGPPADPGVSRLHAVLIAEQGGGWAILDPGSENGTFVNGSEIATGARVPLHDGDRIHIGAWTLITISAG